MAKIVLGSVGSKFCNFEYRPTSLCLKVAFRTSFYMDTSVQMYPDSGRGLLRKLTVNVMEWVCVLSKGNGANLAVQGASALFSCYRPSW